MKIKSILKELVILSFVVFAFGCSSSDDGGGVAPSITLAGSAETIFVGQSVTFTVLNNVGADVTASSELAIAGTTISNPYTFDTIGSFTVTATSGGLTSSLAITVQAIPVPTAITLSTTNDSFWYDTQNTTFIVMDDLGNEVTTLSTLTAEIGEITTPTTFDTPGTYNVVATFTLEDGGVLTSNSVEVKAVESTHSTKVMVEDYTGTWCQFCPRLATAVEDAVAADSNIIPVAIHDDADMPFPNVNSLLSTFGITGFPSGQLNRTIVWNESVAQPVALLENRQHMGLAINSSLSGNTITAEVKVHYDLKVSENHRLVVYILENGLVYPQVNFYNGDPSSPWFGAGNPIPDFVHDHTARAVITNLYGDNIPAEDTGTDSTYTRNFSVAVPGNVENSSNLELVAFVVGPDNTVLNVQQADLGENQDFD